MGLSGGRGSPTATCLVEQSQSCVAEAAGVLECRIGPHNGELTFKERAAPISAETD